MDRAKTTRAAELHASVPPLTEVSCYILVALSSPLHGYAIMQKVERLSEGRVRIGAGILYGALNNMAKKN